MGYFRLAPFGAVANGWTDQSKGSWEVPATSQAKGWPIISGLARSLPSIVVGIDRTHVQIDIIGIVIGQIHQDYTADGCGASAPGHIEHVGRVVGSVQAVRVKIRLDLLALGSIATLTGTQLWSIKCVTRSIYPVGGKSQVAIRSPG